VVVWLTPLKGSGRGGPQGVGIMKRVLLAATVLAATLLAPSFASAGDRYRGYSRSRDYGYHHGGYRGGSRSSFGFSFGFFTGPSYYRPYRPYYAPVYYRPYYRPYYAPPVVYVEPAPVYYPPPVYYRPVYRDYYYDDCGYYSRPSSSFSFSYGRYYR
jgi:hypothetical protein